MRAVQAPDDRSTKPVQSGVLCRRNIWNSKLQFFQNFPSPVAAPIIHDHNLVRHALSTQLTVQVFHRRGDTAFLVPSWNNYRQQCQVITFGSAVIIAAEMSNLFGLAPAYVAISLQNRTYRALRVPTRPSDFISLPD